jgi:hypothetical protein
MNVLFVLLIILIVVIIIVIVLHKSKIFKSPDAVQKKGPSSSSYSQSKTINQYAPQPTWGQPDANPPGSGSGTCSVYTFIGGQYTPAAPSYNQLNTGRGFYVNKFYSDPNSNIPPPTCIDPDQLFAYTYKHTCQNPQGSSSGAGCILSVDTYIPGIGVTGAGVYAPINTTEGNYQDGFSSKIYGQCTPSNLANNYPNSVYCQGNIGLIVPNFKPQPNYNSTGPTGNMCLNGLYGQTGGLSAIGNIGYFDLNTLPCDLSDPGQIFRMTRYTVNSDGSVTQDDNGNVASIVHRYTGYYLAPNIAVDFTTQKDNTGDISTTYFYDFSNVIYSYGSWQDQSGNTGVVSSDLILIPPSADLSRNGVYWLLQNRTFSSQYASTAADVAAYRDVGVMVNQSNYQAIFPNGPAEPSYYLEQTILTPGITNPPPDLLASGGQTGCFFGMSITISDPSSDINKVLVQDVNSNIAPQQIVYIPDLRLLPTAVPADSSRMWSYLINNLSININQTGSPFLTPYRTSSYIDVAYNCVFDPKISNPTDSSNKFTIFKGIVNSIDKPPSDTQFINYNLYTSQVQMGVSSGFISGISGSTTISTTTGNTNYSNNSNPFIPK